MTLDTTTQVSVFLDTDVLLDYFRGNGAAARLFDPDVISRVRYAINPIVLREILLIANEREQSKMERLIGDQVTLLSIDPEKTEETLRRARNFRNRVAHSDEVVIFSSASDCDYLITRDKGLTELQEGNRPEVVTPEEFLARVLGRS
jgi:predicted nucleic acid-binding protein